MTAKVENIDLPQGVRLDPRRGKMGGQYVFVACPVCGRKRRYVLSWYRSQLRRGNAPRTCSRECAGIMRQKLRPASDTREPVDEIEDLPPWGRLDTYRGPGGGRYVVVMCPVCGRERRMRFSEFRARARKGFTPRACSRKCAWVLRRRKKSECAVMEAVV